MKSKLKGGGRALLAVALLASLAVLVAPAQPALAIGMQPMVTGVNPNAGPTSGGTTVTISGTDLLGAVSVQFVAAAGQGGTATVTGPFIGTDTQILVTSPPHAPATVDVTVTTSVGTSTNNTADRFTYLAPLPQVTGLSKIEGPATGGTSVVITGSGFLGTSKVEFGPGNSGTFTVDNDTQITSTSPVHAPGQVDVTVTTPGGTSPTNGADRFTFVARPAVSSVSPSGGSTTGGTTVTISGTDLHGTGAVTFGGTPAPAPISRTDTQITVKSPANAAGPVHVEVTAVGGTSEPTANDQFTYADGPVVTQLTPTGGLTAGGNHVTIAGSGFCATTPPSTACNPGGFTTSAVHFGALAATSFTVTDSTTIDAVAPSQAAATVRVHVTTSAPFNLTNGDTAPNNNAYTYVSQGPQVTSVSPVAGRSAGGTTVTLSGVGFLGTTGVAFGATCTTGAFVVNSDSQIIATSPAGPTSQTTVDVRVTTNGISGCTGGQISPITTNDNFTFVPPPTVSLLSPAVGPAAGGTTVTITGTNFGAPNGLPTVTFGSTPATGVTVVGPTTITAVSPAGNGAVHVIVTTQYGGPSAATASDVFGYGPTVTGVSPNSGPIAGGTSVAIAGTGFSGGGTPSVFFGGSNAATNVHVVDDSHITALSPAGAAGQVDVVVTNSSGASPVNPVDKFTFVAPPSITAPLTPNFGSSQGDTTVTITGNNFIGATKVEFGAGNLAKSLTVVDNNKITAVTPSGNPGIVHVTVTTPGGTTPPTTPNDQYQYVAVPLVTSVTPNSGTRTGGTSVAVTGRGFSASAPVVKFGATPAATTTVQDDSHLSAVSPPANVGTVDITVTTIGGTSPASPVDKFTYTPLGVGVSGIFPGGIVAGYGPEQVTIFGSGFQPGATVTISNPSVSVTAASAARAAGTSVTVDSVSPNAITVTMDAAALAGVGTADVTVHNPDTGTATGRFLVVAPGYYTATQDGVVHNFGRVLFFGDLNGLRLNQPIVGMASTPTGRGYWLVASDGGIFSFGDAAFWGSTGGLRLNKPIVGMASTPSGRGYWLVASDGGIFTFGDAAFFGSTGGIRLNKPVVGMSATRSGQGYWLVATDGGIFTFGDAKFFGSTGGIVLNKPVVGLAVTPSGLGYWLVATDGGIFTFGDAGFFGSTGSLVLNAPVVGMAPGLTGQGYYLLGADGGVFSFNVPFYGSSPSSGPSAVSMVDVGRQG